MMKHKIIQHAQVFNTFTKSFSIQDVLLADGKFQRIADHIEIEEGVEVVDATGQYMIPGLVDIHMHIESSMSIPSQFSSAVLPHGTTSVVADPHEIANVFGLEGILSFLSSDTALDIFYGIPSSVPSTNPSLETTGGKIEVKDVERLLKEERIVCLGEVMNFHDVCYEPESLSAKILNVCKKRIGFPIEGHCPKVTGKELSDFLAQGVSADHTHQSKESVIEKISNGMFLEIQRKSMSQDVIDTLINHNFFEYFAFVTDDVMADHLCEGHLNLLVKKAIEMGMRAEDAIYCATWTPSRRMHVEDRGAIAPGKVADFIFVDRLEDFHIHSVYKKGCNVQEIASSPLETFPEHFYHSILCKKAEVTDFRIPLQGKEAICNVMEIEPHSTFTKHIQPCLPIVDGCLSYDGYALLTVFERYGKGHHKTHAIVANTIQKQGAIATSWAHDHHNVMVLGNHEADMVLAQHTLLEMQGGFVVVSEGNVIAKAQLQVGGIVSDQPIETLGEDIKQVRAAMHALGYHHDNEIMSISTLSLPVSPQLKVSDRGLIDTKTQKIIPLVEEIR